MPSKESVLAAIALLEAVGLRRPKEWVKMDILVIAAVWAEGLDHMTDEQVIAAAKTYASTESKWWPTMGQLMRIGPYRKQIAQSDDRWCPPARKRLDELLEEHGPMRGWTMDVKASAADELIAIDDDWRKANV